MKNMDRLNTCCFIGDNNQNKMFEKTPYYKDIKLKIKSSVVYLIENLFVTNFMTGMDIGFEQCAAEVVLEQKQKYPAITLKGVLPYENFSINWTWSQRNKYYSIMEKSDKEILLQYHYTNNCMRLRNQYMINNSKYIILFQCEASSLDKLILYAKSKKRAVIIIDCGDKYLDNKSIF